MASEFKCTRHPNTGEWEEALWLDNYFGELRQAVRFKDGNVFDPVYYELEVREK